MRVRFRPEHLKGALANLSGPDWASVHFKVALGIMWPIAFSRSESDLAENLGMVVLGTWMTLTAIGTVTSITGMVMTAQSGMIRLRGYRVELVGLVIFLSGPLTYFGATVGYLFVDPSDTRLAQMFLGYGLSAAVVMRILTVRAKASRALMPGKLCS